MLFEWDEPKRTANIGRHGLDFLDADLVFAGPALVGEAKHVDGETRLMLIGLLAGVFVTVIFTMRGEAVRLISMRRARDGERKQHAAAFSG